MNIFHRTTILAAAWAVAILLALSPFKPAEALFLRSAVGYNTSTQITTLQLANNTISTIPANSITPIFPQPFDDMAIAPGTAPIYRVHATGHVMTFSEGLSPINYADGYLQFAPMMGLVPDDLPAGTNHTISGTYSTVTGQIALTYPTTPSFGPFLGSIILSSLSGTGSYAKLAGTWAVISVVGDVVTVQGPISTGVGASTITSGTLTQPTYTQVDVFSGGVQPSPSNRSLCDFNSVDLNQQVVGLNNLSGTYEADLNSAIGTCASPSNVKYHYMGGAAGDVWMVVAPFKNVSTGTPHGQLEDFMYVASLQDQNGDFAGYRYLNRTTAPWYNVTSPAPNYWGFSSIEAFDGATPINNPWGGGQAAPINFTLITTGGCTIGGPPNPCNQFSPGSAFPWSTGFEVYLTNTGGALPTGLSTGTPYWIGNTNEPFPPYTEFQIGTRSTGSGPITPTAQCTGTCTATAVPYITQWGSFFDAQSNGRWNYYQGPGSMTTDPPIQVIPSNTYYRSTKLLPPWAFGVEPIVEPANYPFSAMNLGPIVPFIQTTGEADQIGPFTTWGSDYFFNQTMNDEINVRTLGFIGGQLPINLRDVTTQQIPCVMLSCPSGMPAPGYTTFTWNCGSTASNPKQPATTTVWLAGLSECTTDHIPNFEMQAFLATASPEFMDMTEEAGAAAIYQQSGVLQTAVVNTGEQSIVGKGTPTTNYSINGSQFTGAVVYTGNIFRTTAWANRNMAAAVFASQADPGCSSCSTYFDATTVSTENAVAAYIGMYNSTTCGSPCWFTENGSWSEQQSNTSWDIGYLINSWDLMSTWTGDGAGANNMINFLVKWPAHVNNLYSESCCTSYIGNFGVLNRQNQTYAIQSATYNSVTGQLAMTLATAPNLISGSTYPVSVTGLTGTGSWSSLNQWYSTQTTSGDVVTVTGPTGLSVSGFVSGTLNSTNPASPYVLSDSNLAFNGLGVSWVANSPTFTITHLPGNYAPANGDLAMWDQSGSCPDNEPCSPSNIPGETPYYWCSLSGSIVGSTGVLTTSYPSGCSSPIVPTNTYSGGGSETFFYGPSLQPPYTISGSPCPNPSTNLNNYPQVQLAGMKMAAAMGLTVDSTTITDLNNLVTGVQGSYPSCFQVHPTYFYGTSFLTANDHTGLDEGYIPANDNWHERMLLSGHP